MRIYKVRASSDPKITGVKHSRQSIELAGNHPYNHKDSITRAWEDESIIEPIIGQILLREKAKITDLISTANISMATGIVVSKKLFSFLSNFSIAIKKTYPIPLTYSRNCEELLNDHLLISIHKHSYEMIDFKSSRFCITSELEKVNLPITFKNKGEFLIKDKELDENARLQTDKNWHHMIGYEKLILFKNLKYDLFSLGKFGKIFITEKLKAAIEVEKFSGFAFEERNNFSLNL